jgi:hypothetical protein
MSRASSEFAIIAYMRSVSIEHAEKGLLMMMLGIPISAIPLIRPTGILVVLTGVIWYSHTRDLFGSKQRSYNLVATAVFLLGLGFVLVGSVGYLLFAISATNFPATFFWWWGNNALASALAQSLGLIISLEAVGSIIAGLAYFLFTYNLQSSRERALLWLALATNLAVSLLVFSILNSTYHLAIGLFGFNLDSAQSFENQAMSLGLLSLIPAAIYAVAYYRLYSRIHTGEVPSET